ncbi:MAG: LCP family protein [Aristaeellaceae bacterium]
MRDTLRRCAALLLSAVLLLTAATGCASAVSQDEWNAAVAADAESFSETEGLSDEWWNVLLLGCDSYTKNDYQRTDSMIIVSINAAKGQVKLTSLMRDTWIPVPGSSGHRKLTELCAVGGPELTIRAINESFDMNISDYALISMEGMAEIIDLIGGLDLDVTEEERKALNKGLFDLSPLSGMEQLEQSGEGVHLNGNQATAFARIRKIDSDYVRTERQRTVLLAIADKIKNGASAGTLLTIVTTLMGYVDTNLSLTEIMTIASVGMKLDMNSVEQYRVPVDGTFDSGTFNGVWCIKPNFEKNTDLLHSFIYGD